MKRISLPLWARIIVAFTVAAMVGVAYVAVRGVSLIQHFTQDSIDPKKQKLVLAGVADFPEPLPDGYSVESAMNLGIPGSGELGKAIVVLKHAPDNMTLQLFCNPDAEREDTIDARNFLDKMMQVVGNGYPGAKMQAVKSKGQTTISGHEMAYIVGEFKDAQDKSFEGMIGCICVKDKHKTILLYAMEPPNAPFNLETVMGLLKSVRSF